MDFNPLTDTLLNENGEEVKLNPPKGDELPTKGFAVEDAGFQAPAEDGTCVKSEVSQLLTVCNYWLHLLLGTEKIFQVLNC